MIILKLDSRRRGTDGFPLETCGNDTIHIILGGNDMIPGGEERMDSR